MLVNLLLSIGPCPSFHRLAFLQPKSFWDIWSLSRLPFLSCSSYTSSGFSNRAELSDNKLADSLAEIVATLLFADVRSPIASAIAKIMHTRYSTWRRNLSHNSLFFQDSFGFLSGPSPSPSAYYQNVSITASIEAYRSNVMFKCDILRSIFRAAPWS